MLPYYLCWILATAVCWFSVQVQLQPSCEHRVRERAADMAAVPVVETVHMVPGDGDTSYARNSAFQVSF